MIGVGHRVSDLVRSDQIGEAFFRLAETADAEPQKKSGNGDAQRETRQIELALAAEDAPAEAVDDADHRIEGIEQPPLLRDDARAEADGRDIEPELHDERNDIAEIAVLDVERGDPQSRPDAGDEGEQDEGRAAAGSAIRARTGTRPSSPTRMTKVIRKSTKATTTVAVGHDQPREIDLADQIRIADQAARRLAEAGREERPRQHAGEHHQRVGRVAIRRQLGDSAEDDGEDNHGQERPDHRPGSADHRLLVAHRQIAPSEHIEQFAITPQIAPIVALLPSRLDDDDVGHGDL